jgi:ribosomal protein S8
MTYWEHVTATAIGALLGFLFGLALFWIKERCFKSDQRKKAIKNLIFEFEYNLNLFEEYKKKLTECIEAVSADKRKIYLNMEYGYVARHFARRFYNEGYLSDYLHQEDMKRWNIFLSELSPGSETYVVEQVNGWRKNDIDKQSVFSTLKHERDQIQFAIDMIEYLKTKITL